MEVTQTSFQFLIDKDFLNNTNSMETLTFKNGDQLQAIGLGTWKSSPNEVHDAVIAAVKTGYRHIDCAAAYANEDEVGKALKKLFSEGEVKREDIWITSKLWNNAHRKEQVIPALEKTLNDLDLDYLDLYLMHWPIALKKGVGFPEGPEDFLSLDEVPLTETWSAMEEAVEKGIVKHIGVSNFNTKKIDHLVKESKIKPEMNQVEMHPYLPQNGLSKFCRSNGIHMTAYSPLGSGDRSSSMKNEDEPDLFEDSTIIQIAKKHSCTPAQVLISWHVHRGMAVIPKSVNPERIKQNLEAGEIRLDNEDMEAIASIDKSYRFIDGVFWTIEGSPYELSDLWD